MAFSLFNKKGNEPTRPNGPGGRDAKRAPAREPQEAAAADDGERKGAKLVVEHGFQGSPARGRAGGRNAPRAEAAAEPAKRGPDSVMMMEIQESPFEAAPMLEEAAILYANRQEAAAQQALEEAVALVDVPPAAMRQAWMMLFDLLENQGRRADFETAALAFAVRFETSPPAFNDRSEVKAAARAASTPQVGVGPRLDASSGRQFDHLRVVAAKNRQIGLDLGKIEAVDDAGCEFLRGALTGLRKSSHDVALAGADHLAAMLAGLTVVGRSDIPQAYWLLLLDLYQAQGMQAEFEDAALNYCITYEVSPPSWVDAPKAPASSAPAPAAPEAGDAFYMKGEIEGNSTVFKELGDFAAGQDPVVIDVFSIKRMDFIAAGTLLNLVAALKTAGKHVEIRAPSPLLATLLVTMGFTAYARLVRRKTPAGS